MMQSENAITDLSTEELQPESRCTHSACDMLAATSQNLNDAMVFLRSEFPHHGRSTIHVSALPHSPRDIKTHGKSTESVLNGFGEDFFRREHVASMKRPFSGDIHSLSEQKKRRLDFIRNGKQEISQSDFEMALIKSSLARKKQWIYGQVLQKFGMSSVTSLTADNSHRESVIRMNGGKNITDQKADMQSRIQEVASDSTQILRARSASPHFSNPEENTFNRHSVKAEQRPSSAPCSNFQSFNVRQKKASVFYLKENPNDSKVFDEEGNCYIDSNDFDSFYKPKKVQVAPQVESATNSFSSPFSHGTTESRKLPLGITPRALNFTFHGTNGGFAIDHDCMPKIIAIHSIPLHGRRGMRRHAVAEVSGSTYKATDIEPDLKSNKKENQIEEDNGEVNKKLQGANWWPPSPDSIPDEVTSRDQGLLKVMTHEDRKACGLVKEEATVFEPEIKVKEECVEDDDDDVIVTEVKQPSRRRYVDDEKSMLDLADTCPKNLTNEQLKDLCAQKLGSDSTDGSADNSSAFLMHLLALKAKNQYPDTRNKAHKQPRKKLTMKELCEKLTDTRRRLGNEGLKWKRKLLSSLEVVLIKKIRRLERETGEMAPEGLINENVSVKKKTKLSQQKIHNLEDESNSNLAEIDGNLTADSSDEESSVKSVECRQERRNSMSVSDIRGYESS